ncbi:MAG: hypothetical protein AAGI44_11510 [Pseudomonadota bacterium]
MVDPSLAPTEKIPWPETGMTPGRPLSDYQWGYLLFYADGHFRFTLEERPTEAEIQIRWGHYEQDIKHDANQDPICG